MLKSERKHIILEKVIKERIVSIEDLVQELNSSESTIRRDLDELEAEMGDKVSIFKLNVDDNPVTASEFGVMSIPTLMIKKDGRVVDKLVGVHDKETLAKILNEFA